MDFSIQLLMKKMDPDFGQFLELFAGFYLFHMVGDYDFERFCLELLCSVFHQDEITIRNFRIQEEEFCLAESVKFTQILWDVEKHVAVVYDKRKVDAGLNFESAEKNSIKWPRSLICIKPFVGQTRVCSLHGNTFVMFGDVFKFSWGTR